MLSLIILFIFEPISIYSQSLTLSNRLSINILAGSLSIQSLTSAIIIYIISVYIVIHNIVIHLYLIIYNYEILNALVQLFILNLSSIEYFIDSLLVQ